MRVATMELGNIHFPVDWVLLRDATRTLMKAMPQAEEQSEELDQAA